jgi:hypothetical protein
MKTSKLVVAVASLALAGLAAAGESDDIARAYERYATPGAEHKTLAALEGSYAVRIRGCGKESKGTCERKTILGGLFLQEELDGACPVTGGPFKGIGTYGFDNARKKYVSTWVDSAGSGIMVAEGSLDEKVLTLAGKTTDPITGKQKKFRSVLTLVDAKTQTYELFEAGADGVEARLVEVTYTKK